MTIQNFQLFQHITFKVAFFISSCISSKNKDTVCRFQDAVSQRLKALNDQWELLVKTTSEKSYRLKEANKQKSFMAAVKDLEFWLGEVESQFQNYFFLDSLQKRKE